MIKIEMQHAQKALDYFGIDKTVKSIEILTNDQEVRNGEFAVRIVTLVNTVTEEKFIVKFLNERTFILDVSKLCISTETIEKQSEFSELLRQEGMCVPRKYKINDRFCMPLSLDGIPMDVTVEDYLGEPMEVFAPAMFCEYGRLLGRLHQISLEHQCKIGFSIVFQEVLENRTDFKKIFNRLDMGTIPQALLEEVSKYHDIGKQEVVKVWPELPRSAVQGDLYSCNNVAWVGTEIGFFDFNIAADEVLLGDMLHVWFRTLYDIGNEEQIQNWNIEQCWTEYLRGYQEFRKWSELEAASLQKVYNLLGSIYMGRYAAELIRQKRYDAAEVQLRNALEMLKYENTRSRK